MLFVETRMKRLAVKMAGVSAKLEVIRGLKVEDSYILEKRMELEAELAELTVKYNILKGDLD